MKHLVIVLALLLCVVPITAAVWTGSTDTNWTGSTNWNPAVVPTSTTNVEIPTGLTRYPVVNYASQCNTIIVRAGATLTVGAGGDLDITDYCGVYGSLIMSSTGQITTGGSFFWESGSTADVTGITNIINVNGNMQFASGSNVQLANGSVRFLGSVATTDLANFSSLTQLSSVVVQKSAGTFSFRAGGQPFAINGGFANQPGNTSYNYFTGEITINYVTDNNDGGSYGIRWSNGTVVTASTGEINLRGTSSYLNNLIIRNAYTTTVNYPLVLKGDLRIESGYLSSGSNTITLAGDWENTVGPTAFGEYAGRVIFNGTGHQYCNYSENFNMLEVNKVSGAFRVNSSSSVVTCAEYDWTAGAVDILSGTFTAADLADDGIYGNYYCNTGAVINLFNADGLIGLSGNLYIYGGVLNVFGGTQVSTWPYGANASLIMSGGVLNIADKGITIPSPGAYTFTYNITGGIIQTTGSFNCYNAGFTPSAGTLEMTGTVAATVNMASGTLYNLKTNKTVLLGNNLNCLGGITISGGYFRPEGYDVSCAVDMLIYGTLKMNYATEALTVGDDIAWYNGSTTDITAGSIEIGGFWYMYSGSSVLIPTTVTTTLKSTTTETIYIANTGSQFGNLIIGGTTAGAGYTIHSSSTQDLNVAGYLTITANNELDLNTRNLTVTGALNLNGKLDIHGTTATVHGKSYLETTSNLTIDSGSFICDNSAVVPRTTYLKGTLYINSGTLTLTNNSLTVNTGSVNTLVSGTINCDGIIALSANTFQPAGGTIVLGDLFGGGTMGIHVIAGNWLPNVTINVGTQGYTLSADLIIKGSLNLMTGTFDVTTSNYTITISGSWNHQGGTFNPRSGRVIFNGSGQQYIGFNETFNIVEANKSAGAIRVSVAEVVATIAQYDWTAGSVDVQEGTITINDLADNGMFGGFYCDYGAILNITNSDGRIDLNGLLQITGGEVNIFGGTVYACWPYSANATLTMSSGYLHYKDQGIYIYNAGFSLTDNITGGMITTTRGITCNRTDFNPAAGTFSLWGSTDASINFSNTSSTLAILVINKASTRSNTVTLSNDLAYTLGLNIINGTLDLNGKTLYCGGYLSVNNGTLEMDANSTVAMAAGSNILVTGSGAAIDVLGTVAQPAKFTHNGTGYYGMNIYAGAMLSANYVIFEYVNVEGVRFLEGALIGGLHNCTFRNGESGGKLLVFYDQTATITNASFPTSTGTYNVGKYSDTGAINLYLASGIFAGTTYENDDYNRIYWTGDTYDLRITNVVWSGTNNYLCEPITATVTVQNNSGYDISTPFRVDLYKHFAGAPPAGTLGDMYLEIPWINAGTSKTITFINVSSALAANWTSWLRVDTNNMVAEVNETNNVTTSYAIRWRSLPDIADIAIQKLNLAIIRITWSYPISVSRYNVYRSTDPYFTPGPSNLWIQPTSPVVTTGATQRAYFYKVRAERDLP